MNNLSYKEMNKVIYWKQFKTHPPNEVYSHDKSVKIFLEYGKTICNLTSNLTTNASIVMNLIISHNCKFEIYQDSRSKKHLIEKKRFFGKP